MPRRKSSVKSEQLGRSIGLIDIHFHGAYGIDLMAASESELDLLSQKLWKQGIAGFCPTTLSTDPASLLSTVERLGPWIRKRNSRSLFRSNQALPLGIHLEGPFLHKACCGAHPPKTLRHLNLKELQTLWERSEKTLKIITLAPETLSSLEMGELHRWAKPKKIALSLGHSQADETQSKRAFAGGFRGVTHAWNALPFHHRSPGALGAALGKSDVYVELIIDQIHVSPTLLDWTRRLHPANRLCFISDCAPAAEQNQPCTFGPLQIYPSQDGTCRILGTDALAGGGKILSRSFCDWIGNQLNPNPQQLLKKALPSVIEAPLWALQIPLQRLKRHQVKWFLDESGRLQVSPVDSFARSS